MTRNTIEYMGGLLLILLSQSFTGNAELSWDKVPGDVTICSGRNVTLEWRYHTSAPMEIDMIYVTLNWSNTTNRVILFVHDAAVLQIARNVERLGESGIVLINVTEEDSGMYNLEIVYKSMERLHDGTDVHVINNEADQCSQKTRSPIPWLIPLVVTPVIFTIILAIIYLVVYRLRIQKRPHHNNPETVELLGPQIEWGSFKSIHKWQLLSMEKMVVEAKCVDRNGISSTTKLYVKQLKGSARAEIKRQFSLQQKRSYLFEHCNIVKVLGLKQDEPLAIAYEYMQCNIIPNEHISNLQELLPKIQQCTEINDMSKLAREIVFDCANGLAYLHSKGVALRNIHPKQVLLCNSTQNGRRIVAKWSSLQHVNIAGHSSKFAFSENQLPFQAPEIVVGERNKFNQQERLQADLWSFGCIIYAILHYDISYPYAHEQGIQDNHGSLKTLVENAMLNKQAPRTSQVVAMKYQSDITDLQNCVSSCFLFEPKWRPTSAAIARRVDVELKSSTSRPTFEAIDDEENTYAVECTELPESATMNYLQVYFKSPETSGSTSFQDIHYCAEENRAVITFGEDTSYRAVLRKDHAIEHQVFNVRSLSMNPVQSTEHGVTTSTIAIRNLPDKFSETNLCKLIRKSAVCDVKCTGHTPAEAIFSLSQATQFYPLAIEVQKKPFEGRMLTVINKSRS